MHALETFRGPSPNSRLGFQIKPDRTKYWPAPDFHSRSLGLVVLPGPIHLSGPRPRNKTASTASRYYLTGAAFFSNVGQSEVRAVSPSSAECQSCVPDFPHLWFLGYGILLIQVELAYTPSLLCTSTVLVPTPSGLRIRNFKRA